LDYRVEAVNLAGGDKDLRGIRERATPGDRGTTERIATVRPTRASRVSDGRSSERDNSWLTP
jgi:hypothetical protein